MEHLVLITTAGFTAIVIVGFFFAFFMQLEELKRKRLETHMRLREREFELEVARAIAEKAPQQPLAETVVSVPIDGRKRRKV